MTQKGVINAVLGDMPILPTDSAPLAEMLNKEAYNIQEVLGNMSLDDLENVDALVKQHKSNIAKDSFIEQYALYIKVFKDVQDSPTYVMEKQI